MNLIKSGQYPIPLPPFTLKGPLLMGPQSSKSLFCQISLSKEMITYDGFGNHITPFFALKDAYQIQDYQDYQILGADYLDNLDNLDEYL